MAREITGKHVLFGFLGAFGVIIAVNMFMAYSAIRTFPGLVVKNSYIASQQFNERKAAQEALGWQVSARQEAGALFLAINDAEGRPVQPAKLEALLGRATHVKDDQVLELRHNGKEFVAPAKLARGNWNIRMKAEAKDGTEFLQRLILYVK